MSLTEDEKKLLELRRKLESRGRGEALLYQAEAMLRAEDLLLALPESGASGAPGESGPVPLRLT